jgi:hypothetical protein
MKICDHCDLRQAERPFCSVCGRQTRKWTMKDAAIAAKLSDSRGTRQYGLQGDAGPLPASTPARSVLTRRTGHPIRLAGQNGRLRIKSGPQKG